MGVTKEGAKEMLGLLQTTKEISTAIGQLFRQLKERAMQYEEGLLSITDGAKEIKKAIEEEFGGKAITGKC